MTANTRLRPQLISVRFRGGNPASSSPPVLLAPRFSLPASSCFGARAAHHNLTVNWTETNLWDGLAINVVGCLNCKAGLTLSILHTQKRVTLSDENRCAPPRFPCHADQLPNPPNPLNPEAERVMNLS
jgi:hypothetical protein